MGLALSPSPSGPLSDAPNCQWSPPCMGCVLPKAHFYFASSPAPFFPLTSQRSRTGRMQVALFILPRTSVSIATAKDSTIIGSGLSPCTECISSLPMMSADTSYLYRTYGREIELSWEKPPRPADTPRADIPYRPYFFFISLPFSFLISFLILVFSSKFSNIPDGYSTLAWSHEMKNPTTSNPRSNRPRIPGIWGIKERENKRALVSVLVWWQASIW